MSKISLLLKKVIPSHVRYAIRDTPHIQSYLKALGALRAWKEGGSPGSPGAHENNGSHEAPAIPGSTGSPRSPGSHLVTSWAPSAPRTANEAPEFLGPPGDPGLSCLSGPQEPQGSH